jgi:hypothetical protein
LESVAKRKNGIETKFLFDAEYEKLTQRRKTAKKGKLGSLLCGFA